MFDIVLQGVRTHNLKNIDVSLPRNQLIVITGLSGSGKSSLAFDTIYAEGQRRYVESLSAYARQFLSMMEKPDVDLIEGLSPAIAIEQKANSHNPRSTVGTITEIYDYLRLLYARVGYPKCPVHGEDLQAQSISHMVDVVMQLPEQSALMILSPVIRERKGEYQKLIETLIGQGYIRARIDGKLVELEQAPVLTLHKKHTIEVVIDRIKVRPGIEQRLAESFEAAAHLSDGLVQIAFMQASKQDIVFSTRFACRQCGYSLEELAPRMFSFNNPKGACPECEGLGVQQRFDPDKVVHNSQLSLAAGAIRGWDRHSYYYYQIMESLAAHYKFDLETPFNKLPAAVQHMLLHGSGDDAISFIYRTRSDTSTKRTHPFEGVLPNMERRYEQSDSLAVKEGLAKYLTISSCRHCQGARLREEARHVFINNASISDVTSLSISDAHNFFKELKLEGKRAKIAHKIVKEINNRLGFLINVGLNYLTLARSAETLSGGETQRIRLASQIGSGLVGVMYILDEPSIGLHQRDNQRLLDTLLRLRDLGNTVIVVEHDEETIRAADYVLDLGPGAGIHGGAVIAHGTPQDIEQEAASITGQYLSGAKSIALPARRLQNICRQLIKIKGASCNNLQKVNVDIPIGLLTCVTGVSGSGKSSLINNTLYPAAAKQLNRATTLALGPCDSITGFDHLDKVVDINQSPIGRTPRSNPSTYTGMFTTIRELFARTPEARSRGYQPGRFSFNVAGGRCQSCEGDGVIKVEMHFMADIHVVCDVCKGHRYNRETLDVKYKGKNIYEVLSMTVEEAVDFYAQVPVIKRKLDTLIKVGLGYITLGQSATTLSGGEAQRVKLAKELSKRSTGKTLYILDEPTTGLHFDDIKQLLGVILKLRDAGNTVIIIEHNLDVIKTADWIIDLGPEGGSGGGQIIAQGSPEMVSQSASSHTGRFLAELLEAEQGV